MGFKYAWKGKCTRDERSVEEGKVATIDRPMQIKFKRVFSFVCRFDLTKPMDAMEPLLGNFDQYHLNLDLTSAGCAL